MKTTEVIKMCQFLSAIVLRNGDILCDPEHTDSHEDLIRSAHLRDDRVSTAAESFVRVEYVPPSTTDEIDNLDRWTIKVDQSTVPSWWDDCRDTVEQLMSSRVNRMFVRGNVPQLVGGCWILIDAHVDSVQDARIVSMHGNSRVGDLCDSQVGDMYDESCVDRMPASSRVGRMHDYAQVGLMCGSHVDHMCDESLVDCMRGDSRVGNMYHRSQVSGMWDESRVDRMHEDSLVDCMRGNSRVGRMYGTSQVSRTCDSSRVGELYEDSQVDPSVQG